MASVQVDEKEERPTGSVRGQIERRAVQSSWGGGPLAIESSTKGRGAGYTQAPNRDTLKAIGIYWNELSLPPSVIRN